MRKQLLVAAFAAFLSASAALAGQGDQPGNLSNQQVFNTPGMAQGGVQKARMAPATAERRSVSLKLPAAAMPSLAGYRSQWDAKQGASTFLWADAAIKSAPQAPLKAALMAEFAGRDYLRQQSRPLNASKQSIAEARLIDLHDTAKGPIIARYQQVQDGIEVFGKRVNVMMGRDMRLVASSGNFAPVEAQGGQATNAAKAVAANAFRLSPEQAIATAFADLSGQSLPGAAIKLKRTAGEYSVFDARNSTGEIRTVGEQRVRKFWYPLDGALIAAWYVELFAESQDLADQYGMGYLVSAVDGRVLFRSSLIAYESFTYRTYADTTAPFRPFDTPLGNGYNPFVGTPGDGSTPRVAADTNLVTLQNGPISTNDPWLAPGATETTGNNVDAYADLFGTANANGQVLSGQGFDEGTADVRGAITGPNSFDYPYTPDAPPGTTSQRQFAIVDLFYLNNWLHDWWYDNGFDEAAGNAQNDNYGRGGIDGDRLLVEAQDFSGRNNANMSTPSDGGSPRMQQYLWDGRQDGEVTITPAAAAPYTLAFGTAAFGSNNFDVTGEVISTMPLNGCTAPLTNAAAVAGKIAIIDRGVCGFAVKARNAQDAGAIGVIIANNAPGAPPGMAGADPVLTIGTLSVSQADGQRIRADGLTTPVTARLRLVTGEDVDSTVDAQIVAHEWFHYASNRLVGNALGLSNQQGRSMGEGWSDFAGILLSVRPEDRNVAGNENYQGAYPQSVYSSSDAYFGIRRAPYSTSLDTFPLTFKHIEDGVELPTNAPILIFGANSQVHNTGSIWANTLWEIYASLLNDPRLSFLQAQDRMKSYIIAGLKMTPSAPTILEARDGLLAAAFANDAADFDLMANAFAKRGMGVGAVAPDRDSATHAGVVESFIAQAGAFEVVDAALDFGFIDGAEGFIDDDGLLDPGETALLKVTIRSTGTNDLTQPIIAAVSSDGDTTIGGGGSISFPASAAAPVRFGDTVTGQVTVKLNSAATTAELLTLSIDFPQAGSTPDEVIEAAPIQLTLTVNYDLAPNLRAAENVEQPEAAVVDWAPVLIGSGSGWAVADGNDPALAFGTGLLWFTPNNSGFADVLMRTPPLAVGRGQFTMTFEHYYQFEPLGLQPDGTLLGFDGAILEISSDGGQTWADVVDAGGSFTSNNGYNGVFLALAPDGTPTPDDSGMHVGFVGDNFAANGGFLEPVTLSFGRTYEGRTVQLRFRHVSDGGVGDFGWAVDNIRFTGITNLPFSEIVPEDSVSENTAPVANAGADATVLLGATAALTGSASSDADGDALSFAWTQTSGTATPITNANQALASVTPVAAGTYVFTLTVTDIRAVSSTDTVTVIVNRAPVANAGADRLVLPGATAALDGSASADADGDALSYAWAQTSGPVNLTISNAAMPMATVTPLLSGSYVFTLTVTDARGATSTDTVTVVANATPVADAGPDSVLPFGSTATLDGSRSADAAGDALTYAWVQTSGPAATTITDSDRATALVRPTVAGLYGFTLTVSDPGGNSSSDTTMVTIGAEPVVNTEPVANAGPDLNATTGQPVTMSGAGSSDAEGDNLGYAWTQISGPAATLAGADTAQASFTPATVGSYVFQLTVTDSLGAAKSDFVTVTANAPVTPPPADDGGGGASGAWLLLPMLLLAGLRRRRRD